MLRIASVGCALLLAASAIFAQGTISQDDVSLSRTASSFDLTPEANFVGVGGSLSVDHLFDHGWWFRLAGSPQESIFGVPGSEGYVGNQSFLSWLSLGSGAFNAFETMTVYDGGSAGDPNDGSIDIELQIVNLSPSSPLSLEVFHLLDLDVAGTSLADSATLFAFDPVRILRISDGTGVDFAYRADGQASAFLVRPFGATSVRSALNDASVTNFDNSGLPFGPGDLTAGFQFPLVLPPNGSATLLLYVEAEYANVRCNHVDGIFCDAFEVGSTLVWSSSAP